MYVASSALGRSCQCGVQFGVAVTSLSHLCTAHPFFVIVVRVDLVECVRCRKIAILRYIVRFVQ